MNILVLTIAWPKLNNYNIYTDLVDEFKLNGHVVTVVCSVEARYKEDTRIQVENGIKVLRVKTGNLTQTPFLEKGISNLLLGNQFKAAINKYLDKDSFDLIIMSTPPITLSGIFIWLKRKYQAKTYLLLKDIWPQGIVDLGLINPNGIVYKYFAWQEKRLYSACDYIGCLSEANVQFIKCHNELNNDIVVEVNPNIIKIRKTEIRKNRNIFDKYGIPKDKIIFIFGGNLGKPQGLNYFMKALLEIKNDKAYFLFVGNGTEAKFIENFAFKHNLTHFKYINCLPKNEYEEICEAADIGLILLDGRYTIPNFPSRLLSYCENRLPIFCITDSVTDVGDIVEEYKCGKQILHGDTNGLIDMINWFINHRNQFAMMGSNAFKLLETQYTPKHSYDIIMKHFDNGGQ